MKRITIMLILFFGLTSSVIHAQTISFLQPQCGTIDNPYYHFENFQCAPHGYGYNLFHNAAIIDFQSQYWGAHNALALSFIDDTTGFFASFSDGGIFHIKKIIADSVWQIGENYGNVYTWFTINRHTVYFASYIGNPPTLYLSKISDAQPNRLFLEENQFLSDTTFYDTIAGGPICEGLDQVDLQFISSPDTVTYTIKFFIDPACTFIPGQPVKHSIIPNPAGDHFSLVPDEGPAEGIIEIYDCFGMLKKTFLTGNSVDRTLYIGDLERGLYFIVVRDKINKEVIKLVKL
jgi:hypothetical protein